MRDYAILTSDLLLDEGFLTGAGPSLVDCRDIPGTNCYCSDEALSELRERLCGVPLDAVHWIDTGDCHYLTALFLERIGESFELVLLDNHPDDQAPALGGPDTLSCGDWVAWARERIPEFRQLWGSGVPSGRTSPFRAHPSQAGAWAPPVHEAIRGPRKSLISGVLPTGGHGSDRRGRRSACSLPECSDSDLPVYLSIDLDVLSREEFVTDWDQGEMRFSELLAAVRELAATRRILGIDVCGGLTRAKGATDADLEKNLRLRTELRSFLTALL